MYKRMSKVIEPEQLASLRETYKDLWATLSENATGPKMDLNGDMPYKLAASIFNKTRSSKPMTDETKLSILKLFSKQLDVPEKQYIDLR